MVTKVMMLMNYKNNWINNRKKLLVFFHRMKSFLTLVWLVWWINLIRKKINHKYRRELKVIISTNKYKNCIIL